MVDGGDESSVERTGQSMLGQGRAGQGRVGGVPVRWPSLGGHQ